MTDGMFCGDASGRLVEIFNPPWWRLDRWVRWALTPRARRTEVVVYATAGEGLRLQRARARLRSDVRLTHVGR
jgi:hypothetical protein